MALPPTIPTSFVPHASSAIAPHKFRSEFSGIFNYFAYGVLAIVAALAIGVFLYGRILSSNKATKDEALATAQASIDRATVENFVRLRNRLNSSSSLLDKHPAPSAFFSALETILPSTTRFTSLHLSLTETDVKVEGAGIAKNFNALAATSNAFAADGRIKDAIFSNISIGRDSSVEFALSAKLDPSLIAFVPTAIDATPTSTVAPVQNQQGSATSSPITP